MFYRLAVNNHHTEFLYKDIRFSMCLKCRFTMLSQSRDVNYELKMNVAFDTGRQLHVGILDSKPCFSVA